MLFSHELLYRNAVYLIIIAAVLVFMYTVSPSYPSRPQGIILPAKITYPPVASKEVELYYFIPGGSRPLGIVNIEQHVPEETLQTKAAMENYAKSLAASVGATGIVVSSFGPTTSETSGPFSSLYIFRGEAIGRISGH